jgi:5-formyltetrahydrofolate cyclo-ligase
LKNALPPTEDIKTALRREALARRDSIPPPVRRAKDSMIKGRLMGLREFEDARRVLLYASFRSEVSTGGIITEAIGMGKEVCLPRSDPETCTLSIHPIKGFEDLSPGYMGIPEPTAPARVGTGDMDIVIIPGVAFDARGGRLGYGKGFYDRTLKDLKIPFVALAYEEQITGEIPLKEHDVTVDIIITDQRTIRCGG